MDADLYVPGDGWLHRTDPRVKFLISIVMLALCSYGVTGRSSSASSFSNM